MSDVPMPRDLSEEAVESAFTKRWCSMAHLPSENVGDAARWFRAGATYFRALLREKVREAVDATKGATDPYCECDNSGTGGRIHLRFDATDAIVSRVLGEEAERA